MKKTILLALALFFLIPPLNVSSDDSQVTIKDYLERSLPPQEGRKVTYNEGTKLLTVTDTPNNQDIIKKLIKQFEVGPKQVMIETRFVEVSVTDLEEVGIEWDYFKTGDLNRKPWFQGDRIGTETPFTPFHGIQWDDSTTNVFPKLGDMPAQLMLFKFATGGDYIISNLRALAQQGKVNLLSSPKITTISGQMANIQVVRTYPYVSDFTLENIGTAEFPIWSYKLTLAEKPIGIFLEATPYVTEGSNTITLDLHPEVSVLKDQIAISNLQLSGETGTLGNVVAGATGNIPLIDASLGWPVVDVRTSQTSVAVDSGQTIVMGGMIRDSEEVTKRKVPVLGDIPLLGNLFKYNYKNQEKKSLLILITASIIDANGEVVR